MGADGFRKFSRWYDFHISVSAYGISNVTDAGTYADLSAYGVYNCTASGAHDEHTGDDADAGAYGIYNAGSDAHDEHTGSNAARVTFTGSNNGGSGGSWSCRSTRVAKAKANVIAYRSSKVGGLWYAVGDSGRPRGHR